jgi:hypothetical protein
MIPEEDGKRFLDLARESIVSYFSEKEPSVPEEIKTRYSGRQGCFVTIHKNGQLRGCIGFPEPEIPLWQGISEAARSAAFRDPRFPPLKEEELKDIDIEISVLTVPKEIVVSDPKEYPDKIEIGKHGLIIRSSFCSGLLLPQVATEFGFSPKEFLECLCRKAGLSDGSWKDKDCSIYSFEAQIFSEN